MLARVDKVIEGNPIADLKRKEHEYEMLRLSKPKIWNVYYPNNAELEFEVGFEDFMLEVAKHTKEDLNTISVFRFYCVLNNIKKGSQDG